MSTTLAAPSLPPWSFRPAAPSPSILSAGIVAHNEERNLERAVRSLLEQDLPSGTWWNAIWVVASGCTDGSVEVAEQLVEEDPRVRLVVEPERLGKAHALREVFRRAQGTGLVLLNADACAETGAVAELVRVAARHAPPFAVMGRPVVPGNAGGRWVGTLRAMWELHHEFHLELQGTGGGSHLSDELLLVSLPTAPPLPDGIINDGSYFAVWLAQHGGQRLYAPQARVRIEVPQRMRDHLHQRRRIQYGNDQVTAVLGSAPSTLARYALTQPKRTAELLRRSIGEQPHAARRLATLAAAEVAARSLSAWDRIPPRKDHVRWRRVGSGDPVPRRPRDVTPPKPGPRSASPHGEVLERRVTAVVGVAAEFGTGVALPELLRLLPNEGPATLSEVQGWLAERPHIARMDGGAAYAPGLARETDGDRLERGRRYVRSAEALLSGPLRGALAWVRCACLTGSAAYGEPVPGDDLDLFVVTGEGSMWWFLAYAFLALRVSAGRRARGHDPVPCLNFVLDDREAALEFSRSQGFLFAREALAARPLWGDEYYRGLLAQAPWMAMEIPRLYAERNGSLPAPRPAPTSLAVRCLNAAVFPLLAAYLQLVGLRRNARYRARARSDQRFRTETRWRRLAFASRRFEQVRAHYRALVAGPPAVPPRSERRNEPTVP